MNSTTTMSLLFVHRRGAVYAGRDLITDERGKQILLDYTRQIHKAAIEKDLDASQRFIAAARSLITARIKAVQWQLIEAAGEATVMDLHGQA